MSNSEQKCPYPFGAVLTKYLAAQNISRYKLGKITNISDGQLKKLQLGLAVPEIGTLLKIAKGLGVAPQSLFNDLVEALEREETS